jgi:hypothetical protein
MSTVTVEAKSLVVRVVGTASSHPRAGSRLPIAGATMDGSSLQPSMIPLQE